MTTLAVVPSILCLLAFGLSTARAQRLASSGQPRSGLWIIEGLYADTRLPYNAVDVVLVGPPPHNFQIKCPLSGNPLPTFRWIKTSLTTSKQTEIVQNVSNVYTIDSDGTLHISLNETLAGVAAHDWTQCQVCGVFTCVAENEHGKIFWRPISITTGYMGDFAPDRPSTVRARTNGRAVIRADPPRSRPESVSFLWHKGSGKDANEYLRDDDDLHFFVSTATGNLYFSHVRPSDAGEYRAVVGLEDTIGRRVVGPYDGHSIGQYMYEGRVARSPPTHLVVDGQDVSDGRPMIDPDFPAVVPKQPIKGQDFHLECLAYGRLPLVYTWSKDGKVLHPDETYISRGNRAVYLFRAKFEDSGNYTCTVQGADNTTVSRGVVVDVVSPPKVKSSFHDQRLVKGGNHTWVCDSEAVPAARYVWFRNTLPLYANPIQDVSVGPSNTLHIRNADAATHNGMYECLAVNAHGSVVYAAELTVISRMDGDTLVG